MNGLQILIFLSYANTPIGLGKVSFAALLVLLCANAWCQPNAVQEGNPDSRQERKHELRSTVRQQITASNLAKPGDKAALSDYSVPYARQLSSTERTELRRQLASDPRGQRTSTAVSEQR